MQAIDLLTYAQVAAMIGLSRSAIYQNVKRGKFPQPILLGTKARRFFREDIELYIAQQRELVPTPSSSDA